MVEVVLFELNQRRWQPLASCEGSYSPTVVGVLLLRHQLLCVHRILLLELIPHFQPNQY